MSKTLIKDDHQVISYSKNSHLSHYHIQCRHGKSQVNVPSTDTYTKHTICLNKDLYQTSKRSIIITKKEFSNHDNHKPCHQAKEQMQGYQQEL